MYLKLQKQNGEFEHNGRLIPSYEWLYMGEFNEVFYYKKKLDEIENPDQYGFTKYLFLWPKFRKDGDKTTVTIFMCFDWDKNWQHIGTTLEAYLLNNDGKTIEKIGWNQSELDTRIKK